MNILYLINYAGKGGSEKYVSVLAESYSKNNKIFFAYNEYGDLVEKIRNLNIEPLKLEMQSPFDGKAIKILVDFCTNNKIDVIHTQFARENILALKAKKKLKNVKVIFTSHININANFIWRFLNRKFTKENDAIISVCTKNKELLIKNGYPEDKIKIIFNGVPVKEVVFNPKLAKIRKEFNIDEDTFLFTTISRFTPEKGIPYLLDSIKKFNEINESLKDRYKILIVGDGIQEEEITNMAEELSLNENVIFTGYREDVDEILKGVDCFINSSSSEALSIAILEALSNGIPVIATKVGGNPDIINEKTGCGILVRFGSTVSMARAMEKMISDEKYYKQCSENAFKAIEETFNQEKMLDETFAMYESGLLLNNDVSLENTIKIK